MKGREPARIMIAIGNKKDDRWHLQIAQHWVVQYNFYVHDEPWGRMFVRMCDELRREVGEFEAGRVASAFTAGRLAALDATREVGLYAVDAVVRRSRPLQETREAQGGAP